MNTTAPTVLYIFLDEGGNFDFSIKGSRFFTLTSLTMERPFNAYPELVELKYDVLEEGHDIEYFHATEDKQAVRDRVFQIINRHTSEFSIDSIVIEKRKTHPSKQQPEEFYCMIMGFLLRFILHGYELHPDSRVIILTDRLPDSGRSRLEKALKHTLKSYLPEGVTYRILHHQSKSNFYLQIVDYCNWAIYRKWERNDLRSFRWIEPIHSEFDLFRKGTHYHY